MNPRLLGLALATALLLVSIGCADTEPGIEVPVSIEVTSIESPLVFGTNQLVLDDARLTVFALELIACDSAEAPPSGYGYSLVDPRTWGEMLVPSAHAHVEGSPLIVGTTVVASASHTLTNYDRFTPPPGDYCALRIDLIAADEDAEGMMDDAMLGSTIRVSGALLDEVQAQPVEYATGASDDARIEFDRPLVLKSPNDQVSLTIEVDPALWFEGIDPATCEQPEHRLLEGAGDSIRVRVEQ